jgi:YVTN family beta-propeller protein
MWRSRWVLGVLVLGLSGALAGVSPGGVSAAAARAGCRPTAFVTVQGSSSVSTIDVKTRTKNPTDIPVGSFPLGVAFTPCRR